MVTLLKTILTVLVISAIIFPVMTLAAHAQPIFW